MDESTANVGDTGSADPDLDALFALPPRPEAYGLALSGGGIRATLFHLGAIIRINEMGHLRDIDRFSGVSGGAIAAGLLATVWDRLDWDGRRARNLEDLYEPLVMRLAGMHLDVPLVAIGLVPFISPANVFAKVLDRAFFHGMTLQDLPSQEGAPRFVFNATDFATGTDFRFSRPYMGSYRLGLVPNPTVALATAVAASAAFPPIVSPLILTMDPKRFQKVDGADLFDRKELLSQIALVDGGAYDNLALQPIVRRCHTLLVSDAGGNLSIAPPTLKWSFWTLQVKRTLDITVSQARALRRSALAAGKAAHPYAIWRTRTDPQVFAKHVTIPFTIHEGWPEYLSTRSTRLWPFAVTDRQHLVNWGYVTADLALRSFTWKDAAAPDKLPYPEATFDGPPPGSTRQVAGRPI